MFAEAEEQSLIENISKAQACEIAEYQTSKVLYRVREEVQIQRTCYSIWKQNRRTSRVCYTEDVVDCKMKAEAPIRMLVDTELDMRQEVNCD